MDGFELTVGGRGVMLPVSAQRLLAFLAVHQRPVLRPYIAGTLWPNTSEQHSSGSLRSALWRLRRQGHRVVAEEGERLSLDQDVIVDARVMEAAASELFAGRGDFTPSVVEGLAKIGDLLPGWYEDWVLVERERIRQLRLHVLEVLCERLTELGRLAEAVQVGLAAVGADPLRESSHRLLIKAFLAEGNRVEALRSYRDYAQQLKSQLGLEPSSNLGDLVSPQTRR
jgi:DNA-binding SARP family transcriptional activator